ncbi:hypothetical protein PoB_004350000 [Plakobranchus ocellatus]|uniref:Uncharacterized protein n=1 Tax=Plakobranchus ocellatus TaxID=259542 RepID=A0AAV4BD26_9GAST|nr:hypothetical protein PoB_004350000 [Plakobranchus ocellatus]
MGQLFNAFKSYSRHSHQKMLHTISSTSRGYPLWLSNFHSKSKKGDKLPCDGRLHSLAEHTQQLHGGWRPFPPHSEQYNESIAASDNAPLPATSHLEQAHQTINPVLMDIAILLQLINCRWRNKAP